MMIIFLTYFATNTKKNHWNKPGSGVTSSEKSERKIKLFVLCLPGVPAGYSVVLDLLAPSQCADGDPPRLMYPPKMGSDMKRPLSL